MCLFSSSNDYGLHSESNLFCIIVTVIFISHLMCKNPRRNATLESVPDGWETSDSCAHRPHCWLSERMRRVSQLRDAAYRRAIESGARYFASVDSDVLLGDGNAVRWPPTFT